MKANSAPNNEQKKTTRKKKRKEKQDEESSALKFFRKDGNGRMDFIFVCDARFMTMRFVVVVVKKNCSVFAFELNTFCFVYRTK